MLWLQNSKLMSMQVLVYRDILNSHLTILYKARVIQFVVFSSVSLVKVLLVLLNPSKASLRLSSRMIYLLILKLSIALWIWMTCQVWMRWISKIMCVSIPMLLMFQKLTNRIKNLVKIRLWRNLNREIMKILIISSLYLLLLFMATISVAFFVLKE